MLTDGKNKITYYQYNNTYTNPFYAFNGSNGIFLSISTSFVIGSYMGRKESPEVLKIFEM